MSDPGLLVLICLGGPLVLFGAGFALGRRSRSVMNHGVARGTDVDHAAWLLAELDRSPLREAIAPAAADGVRVHYRGLLTPATAPPRSAAAPDPISRWLDPPRPSPSPGDAPAFVAAISAPAGEPTAPSARRTPRPRPWEGLDSAVVLLYLGAFLVVAAGLVYASYNWAALGGWQKVGLLALTTAGFAAGGLVLLGVRRLRPAAETFVGVGAFLAPINVLAIVNLVAGAGERPALTLELGALLVALLYAGFAFRPGGAAYRYGAAAATAIAVAVLPPAVGVGWGWGAVLLALAASAVPDASRRLGGRWRRFVRPVVATGLVSLPVATLAGVAAPFVGGGSDRVAPAALAAAAVATGRLALWRGSEPLAWGWTGLALATAAATLWVAAVPAAGWAVAAQLVAVAWLALAEAGPGLLRGRRTRALLHLEALALLGVAPGFAALDERWVLFSLTWIGAAVGAAAAAQRRRTPAILTVAGLFATAAYLSFGRFLPERIVENVSPPLLLVPGVLALAGAALALGRRLGGRRGRRWAEPLWLAAGLAAVGVTLVALDPLNDGAGLGERLALAATGAAFAVAAVAGAGALRRPTGLIAAAAWGLVAATASVAALPVGADRRLPLLVAVDAGLAAAVWAVPRLRRPDAAVGRRGAAAVFGLGGGGALATMLLVTAAYVLDRPGFAAGTAHPETGWWWPYLGFYAVATASTIAAGGRLRRPEFAPAAMVPAVAGLLLGLRMATTDLVLWTYAGLALALVVAATRLLGAREVWGAGAFGPALRVWTERVAAATGAAALVGNLWLGGALGEADARAQTAVYAALALATFAAGLRARRPPFTYGAVAALGVAIGFGIDAAGVAAIDGAVAYAVLSWLLVGGALALPTRGIWAGQRPVWERAAYAAGLLPIGLGVTAEGALDPGSAVYGRLILAVLSLAGALAVVAAARRGAARGYAASVLGLAAGLMRIAAAEPSNVQAFTAPVAVYLLAVGWTRRRDARAYDALTAAGAGLLLVPPLLESLGADGFRWALVCGAGALAFVLAGLALRRRAPLACGVVALTAIVLRQTVDAVNALPTWAILGGVGVGLLAIGTATLAAREAVLGWLARGRARWRRLR